MNYSKNLAIKYECDVFVAGGGAAALATDTLDTRKIDVKELQKRLKALGAYLPNS